MSDEPTDDALPFKFVRHGLIVLPGITWDEWCGMYAAVEDADKSAQFRLGDALLAGEAHFGESFAQVVDEKYIHRHTGPMWVCRKIPLARRRPSLSYSLHRELSALDDPEQTVWLDRAEAERWTVKELKEAMAAEKAREPGTNGGPHLHEPPPDDDVYEETPLPIDLDEPEVLEEVPQSTLVKRDVPAPDADTAAPGYTASDIRALIAGTREADAALTAGSAQQDRLVELSDGIAHALGCAAAPVDRLALIDAREALRLIPRGWKRTLTHDGTDEGMWIVELRRGEGMAVGAANSLPVAICEAAVSTLLSDM